MTTRPADFNGYQPGTKDDDNVIRISPGQASISLDLRNHTWPRLSSGEKLLWATLGWLNGVDSLPSSNDLAAGLDADNLAAVERVVAAS